MKSRLLATFGFAALMVGLASAQDKPTAGEKPSDKAQVKEAIQAFNDDDLPKAITILEKALQTAPEDREALFSLSALSTIQGERLKDKAERIASFHKGTATFAKLQKLYSKPNTNEKKFSSRTMIGEARALALEGKTKESMDTIKQVEAMAGGFDKLELIESEEDFDSVRKLPEIQAMLETDRKAKIAQAKKEVATEMAETKPFPFDFELKDTSDKTVALADYKGKVTIVDVWGTWCPPCRKEIPHFVELYKEFKDKGLEIVGINCNEQGTREEIKKTIDDFGKENKINYKCVLDDDKTETKIPGFQGYPTTLFLDRTGKVRMMLVGYTPKPKLEAIITTLLADSSTPAESKPE